MSVLGNHQRLVNVLLILAIGLVTLSPIASAQQPDESSDTGQTGPSQTGTGQAAPEQITPTPMIPDPKTNELSQTLDAIKSLREQIGKSTLSDDEKTAIIATITQAETQATEIESKRSQIVDYQEKLASVGKRSESLVNQKEKLVDTKSKPVNSTKLTELEPLLVQSQQQLASAKQQLSDAENASSDALSRESAIKIEIPKLESKIADQIIQIKAGKANVEGEERQK